MWGSGKNLVASMVERDLYVEESVHSTRTKRCGLCFEDLDDGALWVCGDCQSPMHQSCHEEFQSCITLACPGQRKIASEQAGDNYVTVRHVGLWASPSRFLFRCVTAPLSSLFILTVVACMFGAVIIPGLELFNKYGAIPIDSLRWLIPSAIFYIGLGGYFVMKALRVFFASIRELKEILRIWSL